MKKNIIIFLLIFLVLFMGGLLLVKSIRKLVEGERIRFAIQNYGNEIKNDIEDVIQGRRSLPYDKGDGIKQVLDDYQENPKDFPPLEQFGKGVGFYQKSFNLDKQPILIKVTIYPASAVFYEYLYGRAEKRNIKKEKNDFDRLSVGTYEGNVYDWGYHPSLCYVKYIGEKKFRYHDIRTDLADWRFYQTYTNDFFIQFAYMFQRIPFNESPVKYEEKTDKIMFDWANRKNLKELEKIIGSIKWQ